MRATTEAASRTAFLQAIGLAGTMLIIGLTIVGLPAILFSAAMVGGLALWSVTTWRSPVDPHHLLGLYLLTVALFVVHVGEEYLMHIEVTLATISGQAITQRDFLLFAAFFAPTLWIIGGMLLWARQPLGDYIAAIFIFGMVAGEASHFAFPFLIDGRFHYAPGMVTCAPLIGSACLLLRKLLAEIGAVRSLQFEACGHATR